MHDLRLFPELAKCVFFILLHNIYELDHLDPKIKVILYSNEWAA